MTHSKAKSHGTWDEYKQFQTVYNKELRLCMYIVHIAKRKFRKKYCKENYTKIGCQVTQGPIERP